MNVFSCPLPREPGSCPVGVNKQRKPRPVGNCVTQNFHSLSLAHRGIFNHKIQCRLIAEQTRKENGFRNLNPHARNEPHSRHKHGNEPRHPLFVAVECLCMGQIGGIQCVKELIARCSNSAQIHGTTRINKQTHKRD